MTSDEPPAYQDPSLSTDERVEDLLERMTVEEKIGQLVGAWAGQLAEFMSLEDAQSFITDYDGGSVASFGWSGAVAHDLEDVVDAANTLQETAVEETRLGIPVLTPVDAVHGHAYVTEGTTFPHGLGLAATWDRELAEEAAQITAREMRATGAVQNYAPTIDIARDPRWGRTFETLGESPYLTSELVRSQVAGYQGGDPTEDAVYATAKHFPAYGAPERGEDAGYVNASEYDLRRIFLPPAEAAIDAGVESIMPSYNAINGQPTHGSERFLTDLLRDEMGFEGHVVSDWNGVGQLRDLHATAADIQDAERQTREAGVDVASVGGTEQVEALRDLYDDGEITEARIDESVRRVLRPKFELGLFEDPYVDHETAEAVVGSDDHREAALEAARESVTLLRNDGLLPLNGDEDVFVAGPTADDMVRQRGGWSAYDGEIPGTTILEGIESVADGAVTYQEGAGINETLDVEAAAEKAAEADVAVVAVGEYWYIHEFVGEPENTPKGEFPTRNNMHLPPAQRELVEAIHETGTPTVGVLVSGRPLIVDWMAEHLPALFMSYFPGTEGGQAVAEALFGEVNPSGRLPISVPKTEGDLPTYFNYMAHPRPLGLDNHPDSYDPLFEFGHGLSYTDFEYSDLSLSSDVIGPNETVTVTVDVENVGDRAGDEVVRLFVQDVLSSYVTPERELRGFERLSLEPGESATATFELTPDDLAVIEPGGEKTVEPGTFELTVDDLTAEFEVSD